MKRRDIVIIVVAMVVIAAGAVLINHYAFSRKATIPPPTTPTTTPISQAYRACVADGATISTAIAAFDAQNPGATPTEALLI